MNESTQVSKPKNGYKGKRKPINIDKTTTSEAGTVIAPPINPYADFTVAQLLEVISNKDVAFNISTVNNSRLMVDIEKITKQLEESTILKNSLKEQCSMKTLAISDLERRAELTVKLVAGLTATLDKIPNWIKNIFN